MAFVRDRLQILSNSLQAASHLSSVFSRRCPESVAGPAALLPSEPCRQICVRYQDSDRPVGPPPPTEPAPACNHNSWPRDA
eukprot:4448932-Pyramimonas_sp.AAC.1